VGKPEGFEEIGHVFRLAAAEGDPFTGDGAGDEEGTGFDAVGDDCVFGAVEFADSVDDDAAGSGTFDAGAHAGEEVGEVFDFWFHGSAFDDSSAFGEDGGHHEVAGAEDRGAMFAAHVDFAPAHAIDGLDVHVAALDVDVGSELFESAEVEVDRAVADDAASGQGDTGFAGAGKEGTHDADGGAHFTDEVVGRFAFDGFCGHHDRAAGPFHVGTEASEDLRHVIGVAEIRHAVNDALVACQQSGCENGKRGVFGSADENIPFQGGPSGNEQFMHEFWSEIRSGFLRAPDSGANQAESRPPAKTKRSCRARSWQISACGIPRAVSWEANSVV